MPDAASFEVFGLLGLFAAAFLAGSVLPFPSEAVLAAAIAGGVALPVGLSVATCGNVLGALTVYGLGCGVYRGLAARAVQRHLRIDAALLLRARELGVRYGAWTLLLAWVPVVGDAFVLAAGLARLRLVLFLTLVTLGKAGRYAVVGLAAQAVR